MSGHRGTMTSEEAEGWLEEQKQRVTELHPHNYYQVVEKSGTWWVEWWCGSTGGSTSGPTRTLAIENHRCFGEARSRGKLPSYDWKQPLMEPDLGDDL